MRIIRERFDCGLASRVEVRLMSLYKLIYSGIHLQGKRKIFDLFHCKVLLVCRTTCDFRLVDIADKSV